MSILDFTLTPLLYGLSYLPLWLLHLISDGFYLLVYRVWGYRKKVVRENLRNSFPKKSDAELLEIEKKFYRNLCDLIVESIKTFTISPETLSERVVFKNPEVAEKIFARGEHITGISAHLGNWEWLGTAMPRALKHKCYAIYKPLSSSYFNRLIFGSRTRFGSRFVTGAEMREVYTKAMPEPILVALLSDQAPHDYSRAYEFQFLSQKTYSVMGPGFITAKRGFTPIFAWIHRVGRSRYEWGFEEIALEKPKDWSEEDQRQVLPLGEKFGMTPEQAERSLWVTKEFNRKLEAHIEKCPEDWLWSHRRWKSR